MRDEGYVRGEMCHEAASESVRLSGWDFLGDLRRFRRGWAVLQVFPEDQQVIGEHGCADFGPAHVVFHNGGSGASRAMLFKIGVAKFNGLAP